jgi:hypothetical protein
MEMMLGFGLVADSKLLTFSSVFRPCSVELVFSGIPCTLWSHGGTSSSLRVGCFLPGGLKMCLDQL